MSRLKQLGKDSLIYGIGAILARSVGFFLLPIYTRIFSPNEYGMIEMLAVIANFLAAVLTMGMDSAQSFYFFQQKENGKTAQARLITSILQWRLTWGVSIVVIASCSAPLLNAFFFNGKLGWKYFLVAFSSVFLGQLLSQSIEVFRLLYRPWFYVLVSLANTVVAAGLILFFVIVLKQEIFGYFLGTMLSAAICACIGWHLIRDYLVFDHWQKDWWPILLRFGAPLLPAGISMYVMSASDRWFIQYYHGESALGIYAIGARFALIMAMGIEIFRRAWWPIAMDAMHSDDGPETFRMISRMFMGVGVAGVIYLTFLSPWLVKWFTAPAFHHAWTIVGVLAWQSLFYGFYMIASTGIWKTENTRYSLYLMALCASMNIALNWLFVPLYGGMGAAIATAISYLAWIYASMILSERLWRINFPILTLTAQIAVGAIVVTWILLFRPGFWLTVLIVHLAVMALLFSSLERRMWNALKEKIIRNV